MRIHFRSTSSTIITLILCIGLFRTQDLGAQQRSFVVAREGVPCGRMDLSVERLSSGYVQYEMREEVQVVTIADVKEKWIRSITVLADTALHVISLDGFERRGTEEWRLKGSCVQDILHLSRDDEQGHIQRWREDCTAIPDILLPELIHRLDRALPVKVLSTRDLRAKPTALEIEIRSTGGYRIGIEKHSSMEIDADGLLLSWEMSGLGITRRFPYTGAGMQHCDLDGGILWVGDRLQLPTSVENIRAMELTLAMGKGMTALLTPEDHRQQATIAGDDTLHLHLERAYQNFEEVTLPILDEMLLPYLKSSAILALDDDGIRERAATLRNWERTASKVAAEILRWCGDSFIEDDCIPVVSADRMLDATRGGSVQAAILFVSLSRKAGVPARFVLGLIPERGHWQTTVWAEAWSGEWVSVDPLRGVILEDASHVKLLHSASFAELTEKAKSFRGSLSLTLTSLERIDESAGAELGTGIVNSVYTNRKYRCEITVPSGWFLEERNVGKETILTGMPALGSESQFEMHLFRNPWLQSTDDLFETRVRALSAVLEDAVVEEKGEMLFGQRRAPYVIYTYRDSRAGSGEVRIRTADCMFSIRERGYLLRFTAPEKEFARHAGALEQIFQSMKIFERD